MTIAAANLVGYVATGVMLSAYLLKDHRRLCVTVSVGLALFAAHYALLGAFTTAVMCVFSAVRYCASPWALGRDDATRLRLTVLALIVGIGLCISTWQDWRSVIALVGNFILIVGGFHLRDGNFRRLLLASDVAFAVNAVVVGSVPGLVMCACAILLNAGTIIRAGSRQSLAAL